MRALFAALAVALHGCGAQCDATCFDSIHVTVLLTQDPATLAGATITLCVNALCSAGTFVGAATSAELSGDFRASATLAPQGGGSVVDLDTSGGDHHDGDVLTLRIVDGSGGNLLQFAQPVTYSTAETCTRSCRNLVLGVSQ